MAKPKVLISVLTDEETKQTVFCEALFRFLFEQPDLAPEFVGNYEPIDNPIASSDAALAFCKQDVFWLRKHLITSRGLLFHTYPRRAGTVTMGAGFDAQFDWLSLFRGL